ncbi:MAG: hypoxanthine phosphoribosyltransferase [Clostridia bacterium]|nr:hypoxanthine phosphoribosyltransferase [Clostridia bacterium]
MENDIKYVLISEQEIKDKIAEMGAAISEDYKGKKLLAISVLKGAAVFMSDLIRSITIPVQIDFMVASSYGSGTTSKGSVKIIKDLDIDIKDYDILIVEDILDSGITLSNLMKILESRNPKSIKVCSLLSKPTRHKVEVPLAYLGFEVPDEFVVGYGLDYAEYYRNLPYVGVLKEEVYSK